MPGTFSCIDDVRLAQEFIEAFKHASLDNSNLTDDEVDALLNPAQEPLDLSEHDDKDLLLCLQLFSAQINSSQETYKSSIDAIKIAHPNDELLLYDQIMCHITKLSGVKPICAPIRAWHIQALSHRRIPAFVVGRCGMIPLQANPGSSSGQSQSGPLFRLSDKTKKVL